MKVIITIEGGNVQVVYTDIDCDVEVIDFDISGHHPDRLTDMPDKFDRFRKAFVYTWSPQETNPKKVKELLNQIKK